MIARCSTQKRLMICISSLCAMLKNKAGKNSEEDMEDTFLLFPAHYLKSSPKKKLEEEERK